MRPNPIKVSPSVGFFICAGLLAATFVYFLTLKDRTPVTPP